MTKEEFARVGVRLGGLYCFIPPVKFLANLSLSVAYLSTADNNERWSALLIATLPIVIPTIFGIILIVFGEPIALRIARTRGTEHKEKTIGPGLLMGMATAFAGILIIATSLPDICVWLIRVLTQAISPTKFTMEEFMTKNWQKMMIDFLQLFIGVFLILQSNGIAYLWHRFHGRSWIEKD